MESLEEKLASIGLEMEKKKKKVPAKKIAKPAPSKPKAPQYSEEDIPYNPHNLQYEEGHLLQPPQVSQADQENPSKIHC